MASSEALPSRCLLIGNSRWHWAEQRGASPWIYQHEAAALEALDAPSDLLAWAAVGVVPSHPCLQSSKRLKLLTEVITDGPSPDGHENFFIL